MTASATQRDPATRRKKKEGRKERQEWRKGMKIRQLSMTDRQITSITALQTSEKNKENVRQMLSDWRIKPMYT